MQDCRRLLVNRPAFRWQSDRPRPETGRHYYFTPKKVGQGAPVELTESTIRRHLDGEITIGLYAIDPDNQRCKWLAIDADYQTAMEDLLKLQYRLTQDGVEPALELSRRGGHLWMFLARPLLANASRAHIDDIALRSGVSVEGSGLSEGIEVFPKHDS